MSSFFVENTELLNGDHEVHIDGCHHMPAESNRTYIGEFIHYSEPSRKPEISFPAPMAASAVANPVIRSLDKVPNAAVGGRVFHRARFSMPGIPPLGWLWLSNHSA
ncbi:MAG: hypothetical protein R3F50_19145 [Gammaproteobacteria bacterium]